jgi:hypothetical protein
VRVRILFGEVENDAPLLELERTARRPGIGAELGYKLARERSLALDWHLDLTIPDELLGDAPGKASAPKNKKGARTG